MFAHDWWYRLEKSLIVQKMSHCKNIAKFLESSEIKYKSYNDFLRNPFKNIHFCHTYGYKVNEMLTWASYKYISVRTMALT